MADLTISEKNFKQVRQTIVDALILINDISNDKHVKVAYIKILDHLMMYTYKFEDMLLHQLIDSNELTQDTPEEQTYYLQQVTSIKAQLKTLFNQEQQLDDDVINKFENMINQIDQDLITWLSEDNKVLFNQYLVELIHPDTLSEFIWCNTFVNTFTKRLSIKQIVEAYDVLPKLTIEELYEMYLFISEFNINEILLVDVAQPLPHSENIHKVFEYLYDIIENNINFVPKEQQHLSFTSVIDSYVSADVPTKERFVVLIKKVNDMLTIIEENDNVKVLFTRAYPLFIEAFYQPSDQTKTIHYQLSANFNNTKQYFELLQQTIH